MYFDGKLDGIACFHASRLTGRQTFQQCQVEYWSSSDSHFVVFNLTIIQRTSRFSRINGIGTQAATCISAVWQFAARIRRNTRHSHANTCTRAVIRYNCTTVFAAIKCAITIVVNPAADGCIFAACVSSTDLQGQSLTICQCWHGNAIFIRTIQCRGWIRLTIRFLIHIRAQFQPRHNFMFRSSRTGCTVSVWRITKVKNGLNG